LTSHPDRQNTVALIEEARRHGARLAKACELISICSRTYQRWMRNGSVNTDQRPTAKRPTPSNKYSPQERRAMVALCNQKQYQSRPPAYIVADQLDQGRYVASESTLYRVLREYGQQHHRGRQKAPRPPRQPSTHKADGPNELWSWDITWLPGPARGTWFYLYLIMDVYSRKIVGHEVHDQETGELACDVVEKACWREHLGRNNKPLVLHSDSKNTAIRFPRVV